VKSKANGIIQALLVEEGDPVKEGQVLAELDKADLQAQVRQAQAVLAGGEANLQAAVAAEAKARIDAANPELTFNQRDYDRAQGLFRAKIASQQQVDDADRALQISKNRQQTLDVLVQTAMAQTEQARAQVAAAKAALELAEESLGYATIRAPISGIVLNRPTEVGDAVSSMLNLGSSATLIMTLGDVSSVYIKGDVDEADIGKTELNQYGGGKTHRADGPRSKQRHHVRSSGDDLQSPGQAPCGHDGQRRDRPGRADECAVNPGNRPGV
jgi:HlyD family secretion protein